MNKQMEMWMNFQLNQSDMILASLANCPYCNKLLNHFYKLLVIQLIMISFMVDGN